MNSKNLIIGILITVVWFLVIGLFCVQNNFVFTNRELNSLGDFLAGIFAPVAFLWLIIGYLQQGKQLDQNTKALEQQEKALKLQIEEMRESVKQQGYLAQLQSEQLRMNHNSCQPCLELCTPKLEIMDVRDLLTNKPEKLCSLIFSVYSRINESRIVLLMTLDNTIYQREMKILVDESIEFKLRLDCLNHTQINDFLSLKINDLDFKFKMRFQNIYGLETENIYSYRILRHETGEIQVLKPFLRDSLVTSKVV